MLSKRSNNSHVLSSKDSEMLSPMDASDMTDKSKKKNSTRGLKFGKAQKLKGVSQEDLKKKHLGSHRSVEKQLSQKS